MYTAKGSNFSSPKPPASSTLKQLVFKRICDFLPDYLWMNDEGMAFWLPAHDKTKQYRPWRVGTVMNIQAAVLMKNSTMRLRRIRKRQGNNFAKSWNYLQIPHSVCVCALGMVTKTAMLNMPGLIIVLFNSSRKLITKLSRRVASHDGESIFWRGPTVNHRNLISVPLLFSIDYRSILQSLNTFLCSFTMFFYKIPQEMQECTAFVFHIIQHPPEPQVNSLELA